MNLKSVKIKWINNINIVKYWVCDWSAMEVHSDLGNGFPEVIYQRSLAIVLKNNEIDFNREVSVPLYYKENRLAND